MRWENQDSIRCSGRLWQVWRACFMAIMLGLGTVSAGWAADAGSVVYLSGVASLMKPDGSTRPLLRGDKVRTGETVITGKGKVQLHMVDDAYIALQPETEFRIDAYATAGQGKHESGLLALIRGGLRTITGLIGKVNRENYQLKTKTATIGIRGTEFAASSDDEDGTRVNVIGGIVSLCSEAGCLDLLPGQSGHVPALNAPPRLTFVPAKLPLPTLETPDRFSVAETRDSDGSSLLLTEASSSGGSAAVVPIGVGVTVGGLGVAFANMGAFTAGLVGNQSTFDAAGALTDYVDCCGWGLSGGTTADFGADGIIAWGRWTSGNSTNPSVSGSLITLNYYATLNAPTVPNLVRAYASFASTAPVAIFSGVVAHVGTANSVTGSLNVNFSGPSTGSLTYTLNVPIASQTFTINGSANAYATYGFLGTASTITSSGAGCGGGCTGVIPFGNAIQGSFTGTNAERAGANYGFSSDIGTVTGAVVFN